MDCENEKILKNEKGWIYIGEKVFCDEMSTTTLTFWLKENNEIFTEYKCVVCGRNSCDYDESLADPYRYLNSMHENDRKKFEKAKKLEIDIKDGKDIYFNVPYSKKEKAKELKMKFDFDEKFWYANNMNKNFDEIQNKFKAIKTRGE